jgi:hypothetical protein
MHEEPTQITPPEEASWPGEHENGAGPTGSVLEAVRARRQQLAARQTLEIDLPGMLGLMALRLGPIPGPQLTRIVERQQSSKSPERNFNANADVLIAACVEVLGRARESDPWTSLPGASGRPCRLDEDLCGHLGLEPVTARELIRELFKGAPSPEFAVGYAANEYVEWAAAASGEVDEELLGES